jgi:hypothetical protein
MRAVVPTALGVQHPQWRPLLAVIDEALREAQNPQWARFVPALTHAGLAGRPLLDGTVVKAPPKFIAGWIRRILNVAAHADMDVKRLRRGISTGSIDPLLVFEIALSQDRHHVGELARLVRDQRGVLDALAPLIATPLLHACRRKWADRVPGDWAEGHCRICGGTAALAEVRGGSRHLRCAGCGGDWEGMWRRCPFCGEADADQHASLMSLETFERQAIDVCESCGSYLKTMTSQMPIAPEAVGLQDLATVMLDVAAIEHGYQRPATRGAAVRVVAERSWLRERLGLHA